MRTQSKVFKVALPMLATAVITSAIAVAVTYATAWRDNLWAWIVVVVLTLASGGIALWLYQQQSEADEQASAANDSGVAEAQIGRNSTFKRIQVLGGRRGSLRLGANSHADVLQVVGGLDPGAVLPVKPVALDDQDGRH